jgi:hypothetical protein
MPLTSHCLTVVVWTARFIVLPCRRPGYLQAATVVVTIDDEFSQSPIVG